MNLERMPLMPSYHLPENAAEAIRTLMRHAGAQGHEVAVLLVGNTEAQTPEIIDTLVIPRQEAFRSELGCGLLIDGACLNRVGDDLRIAGRQIRGIIHSHPAEAYHSETDDQGALMRFAGAFSIVTPYFGSGDDILTGSRAYRFALRHGWVETAVASLIEVSGPAEVRVIRDG